MIADLFLASYGILWLLVLVNTLLLIGTLRSLGVLLNRMPGAGALIMSDQGPRIGDVMGPEQMPQVAWESTKTRLLLVFLSSNCALCRKIAPSISSLDARAQPVVILNASEDEARRFLPLLGKGAEGFTRVDSDLFNRVGIEATPFALVLDRSQRVITKGIVNSLEQLESLLASEERRSVLA